MDDCIKDAIVAVFLLRRLESFAQAVDDKDEEEEDYERRIEYFRRRSGKIRRPSLKPPTASAFIHLFKSKQDHALTTLCGFDHQSFEALHDLFQPLFNATTPFNNDDGFIKKIDSEKGRKRKVSSRIALGLVLAWTRMRGLYMILQLIFGLTASNFSTYL